MFSVNTIEFIVKKNALFAKKKSFRAETLFSASGCFEIPENTGFQEICFISGDPEFYPFPF